MKKPHVVYHVAGMGDWKDVVDEQLQLLSRSGLTSDVRITYLGRELNWLTSRLDFYEIDAVIVRSDENLHHCETFAMMEVDRLAKIENTDRPILYMHTKGVSNPGNASKRAWRKLMEEWVVARWRVNMAYLGAFHDAVGVNWIQGGPQHFSGTFWMATPDWIRRLPVFEEYHKAAGLHRYTCELWIGAAQWCRALSLGCKDEPFWTPGYDYSRWMPRSRMAPPKHLDRIDWKSPWGEIFSYFNSDKDTDHSYGPVYDRLFDASVRRSVLNVLEVGVLNGGSLQAWEVGFPEAKVFGMDVRPCVDVIGQRTTIGVANSIVPRQVHECMDRWGAKPGTFDLIVDDGSHKFHDQVATAAVLLPFLKETGTYVIEDVYPFKGAGIIRDALGGIVLDRRGVRMRFDDVMVLIGQVPNVDDLQQPVVDDIPTLFPCDEL